MQTIPSSEHSRTWTVTDIPQPDPRDLAELEVMTNYTGDGHALKAIPLDTYVVPLFKLAPRLLDVVGSMIDTVDMGLTPEELGEVRRLAASVDCSDTIHPVNASVFDVVCGHLGRWDNPLTLSAEDLRLVQSNLNSADVALFVRQHRKLTAHGCLVKIAPKPPQP